MLSKRMISKCGMLSAVAWLTLSLACARNEDPTASRGGETPPEISGGNAAGSLDITPVTCTELRDSSLRDLAVTGNYYVYQDTSESFSMNYMVVGDGEKDDGEHYVVFFPGNSGILLDWPEDMLLDFLADDEPDAECDAAPEKLLEGSLCRNYRLLLLDYPGVGGTQKMSTDEIDTKAFASAVDQLLSDLGAEKISVVGWSLGSFTTLKYANFTSNQLEALALIASKPGGSTSSPYAENLVCSPTYGARGNRAPCICELFETECVDEPPLAPSVVAETLFDLTFPYVDQEPNSDRNACQASVDLESVIIVGVEPNECDASGDAIARQCAEAKVQYGLNRAETVEIDGQTYSNPWAGGVPCDVYLQEAAYGQTWDWCYDNGAGTAFCASNYTTSLYTNGGIALCSNVQYDNNQNATNVTCTNAATLNAKRMRVIYGEGDLFIGYAYDEALAALYKDSLSATTASCVDAGHAVHLQEPVWAQKQILAVIEDLVEAD